MKVEIDVPDEIVEWLREWDIWNHDILHLGEAYAEKPVSRLIEEHLDAGMSFERWSLKHDTRSLGPTPRPWAVYPNMMRPGRVFIGGEDHTTQEVRRIDHTEERKIPKHFVCGMDVDIEDAELIVRAVNRTPEHKL